MSLDLTDIAHECHESWIRDPDNPAHYGSGLKDRLQVLFQSDEKTKQILLQITRLHARHIADRIGLHVDPNGYWHGSGGYGVVIQAANPRWQKHVALKLLLPQHGLDTDVVERFRREHQVLDRLAHAALPRVYEAGKFGLQPYYVMEFGGRNLEDSWQRFRKPRDIAGLGLALLDLLAYLKAEGITHRDIKPRNILVTDLTSERVLIKLIDFGIAKDHRLNPPHTPTELMPRGTEGYSAPEVVDGRDCDHRSDLFSVGRVLLDLLDGRVGIRSDASSDRPRTTQTSPPPVASPVVQAASTPSSGLLATVNFGLDANLRRLAQRCCATKAEHRPDPASVKSELENLIDPRASSLIAQNPSPWMIEWLRKRGRAAVTAIAATLLLMLTLTFFLGRWTDGQRKRAELRLAIKTRVADAQRAKYEGQLKDAEKHYQEALALLEPERELDFRTQRAELLWEYARFLQGLKDPGKRAEALKRHNEAIKLWEQLDRDVPGNRPILEGLGRAYGWRGDVVRDTDAALNDYKESLRIRELTLRSFDDATSRRELGLAHWNMARLSVIMSYGARPPADALKDACQHWETALVWLTKAREKRDLPQVYLDATSDQLECLLDHCYGLVRLFQDAGQAELAKERLASTDELLAALDQAQDQRAWRWKHSKRLAELRSTKDQNEHDKLSQEVKAWVDSAPAYERAIRESLWVECLITFYSKQQPPSESTWVENARPWVTGLATSGDPILANQKLRFDQKFPK